MSSHDAPSLRATTNDDGPRYAPGEAAFTPGPLYARPDGEYADGLHSVIDATALPGVIVATASYCTRGDALLYAAAPDIYYALKLCLQRLERPNLSPDANVVTEKVRAALAKAEGR